MPGPRRARRTRRPGRRAQRGEGEGAGGWGGRTNGGLQRGRGHRRLTYHVPTVPPIRRPHEQSLHHLWQPGCQEHSVAAPVHACCCCCCCRCRAAHARGPASDSALPALCTVPHPPKPHSCPHHHRARVPAPPSGPCPPPLCVHAPPATGTRTTHQPTQGRRSEATVSTCTAGKHRARRCISSAAKSALGRLHSLRAPAVARPPSPMSRACRPVTTWRCPGQVAGLAASRN